MLAIQTLIEVRLETDPSSLESEWSFDSWCQYSAGLDSLALGAVLALVNAGVQTLGHTL